MHAGHADHDMRTETEQKLAFIGTLSVASHAWARRVTSSLSLHSMGALDDLGTLCVGQLMQAYAAQCKLE